VRLLQGFEATAQVESHLLVSEAGVLNLHQELDMKRADVERLPTWCINVRDIGASSPAGRSRPTAWWWRRVRCERLPPWRMACPTT
jgi:3-polyprenyl-4-hydroxybenzoate decarboxylase